MGCEDEGASCAMGAQGLREWSHWGVLVVRVAGMQGENGGSIGQRGRAGPSSCLKPLCVLWFTSFIIVRASYPYEVLKDGLQLRTVEKTGLELSGPSSSPSFTPC